MLYILITIIIIAFVLFILSSFMNDKLTKLEEQVEEMSLMSLQETYKINQKLDIIEEEFLVDNIDIVTNQQQSTESVQIPLFQKIKQLHKQGFDLQYIANETGLTINDVKLIVQNFN